MRCFYEKGFIVFYIILFFSRKLCKRKYGSFFNYVNTGNIEQVKKYLSKGMDINIQNTSGQTPLMAAVYNNDVNMVQALMSYNPDVNIQDNRKNYPFLYTGARGYLVILKLIYKKADTKNVVNIYGGNALIPACEKGHLETVIFLLNNTDINVNHINNLSWTALLEVTILGNDSKNYQEIVKVLLKHGADKTIKDNNGKTALDDAKERNLKNIDRLLK